MAYLALYRKYRPKDFDSVVGQEYVTRILRNQIRSGRVGHAYLFSGIRGTGKTTTAKIFARAINCEHPADGNPCYECETCQNIERPGVMDIIEIDGASNRGVDEIREIREKVKYPPTVGKYKVYIIDEVHMLTKEAFNALLKTLEEPPSYVVFILATTEPNRLPATILSRCQRFDIKPISQADIVDQMKRILSDIRVEIEEDALQLIAYRGDNSMRDALSLLDQVIDIQNDDAPITEAEVLDFFGMADDESIFKLAEEIFAGEKGRVLARFKEIRDQGRDSTLVYDQLMEMFRKILIVQAAGKESMAILGLTENSVSDLKQLSETVDSGILFNILECMIDERAKLKFSGLSSVVVEMILLKLCMLSVDEGLAMSVEASMENRDRYRGASTRTASNRKRPLQVSKPEDFLEEMPPTEEIPFPDEMPVDLAEDSGYGIEAAVQVPGIEQRDVKPSPVKVDEVSVKEETKEEEKTATGLTEEGKAVPRETVSSSEKKAYRGVNTDKLYKFLIQVCQKNKPMVVAHLQKGRLSEVGEKRLVLRFNPDQKASVALLNLPNNIEFLSNAINQAMKESYDFKVEIVEKSYEEMTMAEKTRSIFKDRAVEIVEID